MMLTAQEITEHVLRERLALTAYIGCITRNHHLAEDVYQEVCVKAVSQTDKFSSKDHLMNWFRISARNRAIDVIRTREGRYVGLTEATLLAIEQDWDRSVVDGREELLDSLSKCLEALAPRSQQIVKLRYFENRSGAEIAKFMGAKIASAYQAIARIHKSLGDCVRQRLELESL
jgi:RNA polymerase sigma-70 factor (ECF subfamily)